MKQLKKWINWLLLLSCSLPILAQTAVSGRVVDAAGEPIIGASILVKGTSLGTITDIDGRFSINALPNATLIVSYIGFQKQEITLGGRTTLQITMKEDAALLDEVVVMAYNTTIKRKLTNAVTVVDVGEVNDLAAYSNMTTALQGRAPGVYINQSTGMPGSSPSLRIRGNTDAPLYVIDGVVQDAETFNKLNSQDIESINVMKDAASAAVYGAIAGNGVVVVKTCQGTIGRARINYTVDQQIFEPTKWKTNLSSYQLAATTNAVRELNGYDPRYTEEDLQKYLNGSDPVGYPNVNWRDITMRKLSTAQRHSLTMDGGSQDTQYHISLGYYDQGSLLKPVNGNEVFTFNQFNANVNVAHTFREIGLRVGLDFKGSLDTSKGKGEEAAAIAKNTSMTRLYNANGQLFANTPYLGLDINTGYTSVSKPITNTRLNLDWEIPGVKGLVATFMGNYRNWNSSQKDWMNAYVASFYDDGSPYVATTPPSLTMRKDNGWRYELNVGVRYSTEFLEKHSLSVAGYYNQLEEYSEWISATRQNFLSSAVDEIFAGPTSSMLNDGGAAEKGRIGFVGVLNYDYDGRYILSSSFRYDGSDNYAKGNRWGFFPSLSLGWVLSDEAFMERIRKTIQLNMFKIRASYGETGIDQGRFAQYANWSLGNSNFDINGERASSINIPGLISPDLSWYSTKSTNFGIDFAFFNNRLSGTLDYFYQDTKGYLINPSDIYRTPLGTALPQIKSNDQFRKAGAEIMIHWKSKVGQVNYEIGGNLSFYDRVWIRKNESITTATNPLATAVGKTTSDGVRVWITDGLYQNAEQLLNSPHATWTANISTGDIKYLDMNGDGRIDTNANGDDFVYNGKPAEPIMQYGIDFALKYNGFFLNGLFQGAGTNYKKIGQNAMPMGVDRIRYTNELDYWTPSNTNARFPLLDIGTGTSNNNQKDITYWMVDCAYFRLKNLQVGYDFKYKLLKRVAWLTNAKLSFAGQNIFTMSDATYFMDPEQGNTENNGYPITRTYSIVLSLGF